MFFQFYRSLVSVYRTLVQSILQPIFECLFLFVFLLLGLTWLLVAITLASLYELFTANSREPLIMQKFLPDVSNGDKRVILVDGEPVGAINRVPAAGETR